MVISSTVTALATDGEAIGKTLDDEIDLLEDAYITESNETIELNEEIDLHEYIELETDSVTSDELLDLEDTLSLETANVTLSDITYHTGYKRDFYYDKIIQGNAYNSNAYKENYESSYVTPNLPPLRNQGDYETSWAFATISLAEINLIKEGINTAPDLSELHLSYFTWNSVTDRLGGTDGDFIYLNEDESLYNGGNFQMAFTSLSTWTGLADESAAPYYSANKLKSKELSPDIAYTDVAHVDSYYVAEVDFAEFREYNDISVLKPIKKMIKDYGGAGMYFGAETNRATAISSNIYSDTYKSYYNAYKYNNPNHTVVIVGWDDNFPKDNFAEPAPGNGAFLVRNSWDSTKSLSDKDYAGYFWMSYYERSINDYIYAVKVSDADNYDNNYQYDGYNAGTGWSDKVGANVFTAKASTGSKGELLKAVSFYSGAEYTTYKIEIYTDVKDLPSSGTLVRSATTTGTTEFSGYVSVPLKESVNIEGGTKFAVVVSLADNALGYNWDASGDNYKVSSHSGESFSVYPYGGTWCYCAYNFKIKAYTDNVDSNGNNEDHDTDNQTLSSISFTREDTYYTDYTGKNRIKTQLTPHYVPSDYVPKRFADWRSLDESIAYVDNNGLVTYINTGKVTIVHTVDGVKGSIELQNVLTNDMVEVTRGVNNAIYFKWYPIEGAEEYRIIRKKDNKTAARISEDGSDSYEFTDNYFSNTNESAEVYYSFVLVIGDEQYSIDIPVKIGPNSDFVSMVLLETTNSTETSATLVPVFTPSDYVPTEDIKWTSSDEITATVDNNGKVTFKDIGTTTITATVDGITASKHYQKTLKVKVSHNRGKVTLSWDSSSRIKHYSIYRYDYEYERNALIIDADNTKKTYTITDDYYKGINAKQRYNTTLEYAFSYVGDFEEGTILDSHEIAISPSSSSEESSEYDEEWGNIPESIREQLDYDPSNIPIKIWFVVDNKVLLQNSSKKLDITKQYTGSKITFDDDISVYYNKKKLKNKTDYAVTYSKNISSVYTASSAPSFTIKTKGDYTGTTKTFTFNISPAPLTDAVITSETLIPVPKGSKKLSSIKVTVSYCC